MKPNSLTKKIINTITLAMLGAGIFLEQSAVGQPTFTWTGGGADGNWTTANNWGGTAPASPQVFLNFTNATRVNNTNNFAAGSAGYQIYFKAGAVSGPFNLYGNSIAFFDFGTVDPNIQNEGTVNTQTINFPIVNGNTHGANGILNINLNASPAQGPLVFNGTVSNLDALVAVRAINVSGGSPVRFNGVLADFSSNGKLALTQLGGGTTTLAATNTYTGATTINAGRVTVDAAGLLGGGSYAGAIAIAGGAVFEYAGTNAQTLSGAITGAGGLTKSGILKSDLTLSSTANTYSGTTTITNGRIAVTAPGNLSGGATVIVQTNAGQIFFNITSQTFSNSINISSIGYPEGDLLANTDGAIRIEGSTLAGTITLSGNSRIGTSLSTGPTNLISGQITGGFGLDLYGMNLGGTSGNRELFVLSNPANNFTGGLALYNRDYNAAKTLCATTLRLGASGVIPSGASAGNLSFTGADANHLTILDLYGFNQTINGTTVTAASGARITNSASSASVLTIGANNTTSTFSGLVSDGGIGSANTVAITKTGTGTFILNGANIYAGNTTVNAGTLQADNSSALGSGLLVLNGGALSNNVSATLTNNINLAANAIVGIGASQTLTLGGVITNTGSLTTAGSGTLSLTNANGYSGGTVINGSVSPRNAFCFGSGTVTVNSGGQVFSSAAFSQIFTNAVTLNGGQLHTGGGNANTRMTWSGPVTVTASSSLAADGGTLGNTFTGGVSLGNSGYTLTCNGNGNNGLSAHNFSSVISGGPNATLLGSSSGLVFLNAANTFSGTNRSGYSLVLQNANALQNATLDMNAADNGSVTLISGAVLGALTGSRNLNMGGFTVSIGNNNASTAFTGALTNSGSLIKIGTGTLTLSGVNTYSNITLVSAGKLALSGSGSLGSTNIIVGGGATFDVSGLTTPFAIGSSVTLSNNASGAIINGTNNCSLGTISLRFDGVNPCFIQTNGTMTISSSTVIKVFNSGTALPVGTNTIIAAATSGNLGLVTGSLPSVVVTGNGVAAGNSSLALLQTNINGGLDLIVLGPQTWTGASDTSWTTADNWLSGMVPGSGSAIVFNSASVANLATVLNTNFSIYSVIVTNPSGPVSIGGANTLTMAGGINMSSASQNLSIASPVIMSASQTWSVTNGRTLNVSSNVSGSAALTVSGGGTVMLGASNSYTGSTTINGGTVQAGDNNALGTATITLAFGAASNGKLQVNSRSVSVGSLSGDATATIENANSSPGALTINNSGSVTFPGVFQDGSGGGALALNKSGAGTLTLSATNTFSGGTTISAGIITAGANNSLGSGTVNINGGIRLLLANGVTITNAITIGANAGVAANNLLQVSTGSSATLAGPIIINNGAVAGGHVGSTDANGILNVQGFITVNNGVTLLQRAGTVVYSGGGNYTNVQVNQDKVVVGANNGIATSANFNTSIGASAAVTFDLNGFNQTIAGITRAGANAVNVTNSSTTADSTLTLNGVSTFAGSIVDSGSGTKVNLGVGGGTFTLTGNNRYRGNTLVSGGTLALSGGAVITNSANIVVASGAIFDVSALTSTFTLAQALPGQTLSNIATGAIISGNNNTASGTVSLIYDGVNPSFIITNGTMTLSTATVFKVNNTGAPLTPGTYKIISKTTGGTVAGTVPSSVAVTGGPSAGTPTLAIVGGELYLTVGGASSISYTATGPFTYNGAAQSPTVNFTGSTGAQTSAYVGVSVSYGPSADAPTNTGSYYVSNTVATDADYFGATNSQGFTINTAPLGITANDTNKSFGQTVTLAGTEFTASGLLGSDSVSSVALTSAGVTNTATVGSYAIVASAAVGSGLSNYTISYTNGTLTVNPASTVVGASSTMNPSGYRDAVSFLATLPADASGSVVFSSVAGPLSTNSVSGATTSSLSFTNLTRGTNAITVAYLGVGSYVGSTNSFDQIVTNHPPTAANASYYRAKGIPLKIALVDLFTNVADVDGDTIALQSVGAGLTNATILTDSTYIYYLPGTGDGSNDNDIVSYTVTDGFGGAVTADILINVYSANGQSQMSIPTNGVVNITFFGIPNYTYVVQTTTNLSVPWWTLSTNTAGTNGIWLFTDLNATNAQQYYRSAQP